MNQQEIVEKQRQYLWPNHSLYYSEPVPLDHGDGLYVWDVEGNRYLDFFAGILTTIVGHNFFDNGWVATIPQEKLPWTSPSRETKCSTREDT